MPAPTTDGIGRPLQGKRGVRLLGRGEQPAGQDVVADGENLALDAALAGGRPGRRLRACSAVPARRRQSMAEWYARAQRRVRLCPGHLPGPARLAFLTACGSACNVECLADDALHIASPFPLAGFPTAVGTLWKIDSTHADQHDAERLSRICQRMQSGARLRPADLVLDEDMGRCSTRDQHISVINFDVQLHAPRSC
ncbi:CHAT domain-containing protein [Streptomyces olivaceus]|uniref:CHAT domain-containing protein n=1 Tax=Streptomyces olivaceus TaxID=47716 RepID=UPI003817FA66